MHMIFHNEMVRKLIKPGEKILEEMTGEQMHRLHMAGCICGESGELFDAVKKESFYQKDIDRDNVIEELGDLEFYMEGLRQSLNITREETIQANINKLDKRYKDFEYSNQAAQERKDKQ